MRIGIIGGGLMGLALAERLGAAGHHAVVYERGAQVGGLATWQDFGSFTWDRFYHVILPSDSALLALLRRIGLAERLRWRQTRTGYFVDGRCYSISNGLEFLRFPPLDLLSKVRLAATILLCSRIRDWRKLEQQTVEQFLVRTSGRRTFEKFWKPLLLAKLGEHYRRVSAVFIWTYVRRLFSARDAAAQREQLGYVSGGYRTVFARLLERIEQCKGLVLTGIEVTGIRGAEGRGLEVCTTSGVEHFDKVIFTGPVDAMRRVVEPALVEVPPPRDVEYLGVVCLVLVSRKPVVPYYVVNISDERVPFTGVIGMSSLVDTAETNGRYLTYLPKYVLSSDPLLAQPEAALRADFLAGLERMFPEFDQGAIERAGVHRASRVQPLPVVGYSNLVQAPRTRHADFYIVNTAQFVANTLNNNEVARAVDTFLGDFAQDFT
jgi:protoporphyrinogen oxidase